MKKGDVVKFIGRAEPLDEYLFDDSQLQGKQGIVQFVHNFPFDEELNSCPLRIQVTFEGIDDDDLWFDADELQKVLDK